MIKIIDVSAISGDSAFLIDDGKTAILYDSGLRLRETKSLKT